MCLCLEVIEINGRGWNCTVCLATVALRCPTLDVSLSRTRHNLARGIDASMPNLSSPRCLPMTIENVSQSFISQKRKTPTCT